MKEKLNLQEIVSKMAHETGASKKETEEFLRSLFAIIPDALLSDKVVKINGLGTFKLVLVESRESVNVNTKEKYEIPAHYKLSFVPDSQLKEMVNDAFSAFEAVELDENATPDIEEEIQTDDVPDEDFTEDEGDDADETVETFAKSKNNKETEIDIEALLKYLEEEDFDTDSPDSPESDAALLSKVLREQRYKTQATAEEMQVANLPAEDEDEDENDEDAELREYIHHRQFRNKKETHRNRMWTLAIFLMIALLATGIYYAREYGFQINFANKTEAAVTNVAETQPTQEAVVEAPQAEELEKPEQKVDEPEPIKLIAKVTMDPTMTLTAIAQKYYGSKIFWVYLYIANRSRIKNPNIVPSGTIIEVPAPEAYGIDVHDAASVKRANELASEIQALFY